MKEENPELFSYADRAHALGIRPLSTGNGEPPDSSRQLARHEAPRSCLGSSGREAVGSTTGAPASGAAAKRSSSGRQPPACNTGVTIEKKVDFPGNNFYGWDWSATTHDAQEDSVYRMLEALGSVHTLPGKGLQGWSQSVKAFDAEGYQLGSIYFGGGRKDIHVVSTSSVADSSRPLVTRIGNARTARVDTRVDTLVPFEQLEKILTAASETYGSRITYMEAKKRGDSLGKTLYLGAPASRIRVRVYEKWLESPGQYVEGTNRVEVQLRPNSRAKAGVSAWEPAQTFCASKTTRDLAMRLGDLNPPVVTVQKRRPTPTLEESLEAMGNQYGKGVRQWLDFSGGDIGTVLDYLTDEPSMLDISAPVPF